MITHSLGGISVKKKIPQNLRRLSDNWENGRAIRTEIQHR